MEFTPIYTGIFDSHAHYDSKRFDEDRHQLLESLPGLGVCGVLDVGCDFPSSQAAVELAARYPHVYASVGYHPHEADSYTEEDMEKLLKLFESPKVRAISRRPSGLRKTTMGTNSLAHRTTWLRSDFKFRDLRQRGIFQKSNKSEAKRS